MTHEEGDGEYDDEKESNDSSGSDGDEDDTSWAAGKAAREVNVLPHHRAIERKSPQRLDCRRAPREDESSVRAPEPKLPLDGVRVVQAEQNRHPNLQTAAPQWL
nr:unnamed protein product [Digitaria exilis]